MANLISAPCVLSTHACSIYLGPCVKIILSRLSRSLCSSCLKCCVFTDKEFPPDASSLGSLKRFLDAPPHWLRANQINSGCEQGIALIRDGITAEDVAQGALGDCWLLSAFACLTEFPGTIENLFVTKEINVCPRPPQCPLSPFVIANSSNIQELRVYSLLLHLLLPPVHLPKRCVYQAAALVCIRTLLHTHADIRCVGAIQCDSMTGGRSAGLSSPWTTLSLAMQRGSHSSHRSLVYHSPHAPVLVYHSPHAPVLVYHSPRLPLPSSVALLICRSARLPPMLVCLDTAA